MIPISSSTSLSIENSAKLLQSLVDLEDKNVELPKKLAKCVDDFLDAQQTFLREIDEFLHDYNDEDDSENKLEILKTIVEPYPEFLATMDEDTFLPCHCEALKKPESSYSALKLYAEIGRKHNIGEL